MRSGNGRHRRPRQAPAIVVAAGVTGSALALPLLATGSASAADAQTWDRVAECESGGAWSANFGNGLYGGLQFTQDGWERHGGLTYAPSPDLASRAQQIAVAEKALAAGDTQWDTCAPIAGLKNDGKAPAVDPGSGAPVKPHRPVGESSRTDGLPAANEPNRSESDQGGKGKGSGPAAPGGVADPTWSPAASTAPAAPNTPAAPASPDASPDASAAPGNGAGKGVGNGDGNGKHRGDAAPEETGNSDTVRESGRHAAPGDGVTGGEAVAGNSVTVDKVDEYIVRPGDSLSGIAQKAGLTGGWSALYDANKKVVGVDPDLILPGQNLDIDSGAPSSDG